MSWMLEFLILHLFYISSVCLHRVFTIFVFYTYFIVTLLMGLSTAHIHMYKIS